jgi:hypothetical protein
MADSIETVLALDPRIVPQKATRVIRRGAENLTYDVVPPNGGTTWGVGTTYSSAADPTADPVATAVTAASSHVFQIPMGSDELLQRRIDVRLTNVVVSFKLQTVGGPGTAATAATATLVAGQDALKAFPVNRCLANSQVKVNGETISVNPSQNLQCYLRTSDKQILQCTDNSLTPSYLDNVQEYSDLSTPGAGGLVERAVQNPLGIGTNYEPGRGYFPQSWVLNQSTAVRAANAVAKTAYATVLIPVIQEPLMVPCLWMGNVDEGGAFDNIQSDVEVRLQWLPNLQNLIWAHAKNALETAGTGTWTITGVSADINLICTRLRRPKDVPGASSIMVYPNNSFDVFVDSSAPSDLAVGQTYSWTTSTYKFGAIPSAFFIYWAQDITTDTGNGPTTPDRYARIHDVSISFNGVTGLLAGASQQQLYQMTINNLDGVDDYTFGDWSAGGASKVRLQTGVGPATYIDAAASGQGLPFMQAWDGNGLTTMPVGGTYQRGCGSFLYLTMADLGCPDSMAPGMVGSFNFRITANISNASSTLWPRSTAKCYVFALYDGLLSININGSATQSMNVIDAASVLTSSQLPIIPDSQVDMTRMIGGGARSLFGRVGTFIHSALPYIRKGASVAKRVLPYAGPGGALAADVLEAAGAGGKEDDGEAHLEVSSGGAAGGGGRMVTLDTKPREMALVSSILRRRR